MEAVSQLWKRSEAKDVTQNDKKEIYAKITQDDAWVKGN